MNLVSGEIRTIEQRETSAKSDHGFSAFISRLEKARGVSAGFWIEEPLGFLPASRFCISSPASRSPTGN